MDVTSDRDTKTLEPFLLTRIPVKARPIVTIRLAMVMVSHADPASAASAGPSRMVGEAALPILPNAASVAARRSISDLPQSFDAQDKRAEGKGQGNKRGRAGGGQRECTHLQMVAGVVHIKEEATQGELDDAVATHTKAQVAALSPPPTLCLTRLCIAPERSAP